MLINSCSKERCSSGTVHVHYKNQWMQGKNSALCVLGKPYRHVRRFTFSLEGIKAENGSLVSPVSELDEWSRCSSLRTQSMLLCSISSMPFIHINMKQLYLPKALQGPFGPMLMWHSIVHTTARKYKIVGMKRTARAGHLISAFL